eukprot:11685608-Karenia_brevis.AAC.1
MLGQRLRDFLMGSDDACSLHVAWWIFSKSMREALCYDLRILPYTYLRPLLDELEEAMREVATALVGYVLSDDKWCQMQLPGPLGGLGVRLASNSADAAFLSTWMSTSPKIKVLSIALGRPVTNDFARDDALEAANRLLQRGVRVDTTAGAVAFT